MRKVLNAAERQGGLCVLPLVSHTFLARLKGLWLAVGRLRGQQALCALDQGRWSADGHRAWSISELDFGFTQVRDLSALVGCSSLRTLDLRFFFVSPECRSLPAATWP